MFKYLIFFIIFIVFIAIVLSQRSNISESFSDWISPATDEHNQRQVAILPKFANMDVYFDLNNGSVYLINGDKVMVLRRRHQPKYPIFNISSEEGLNKLKKYCSERKKMNKQYNHWIYKHDDNNMLIYAPRGLKTKITLMTNMDGGEDIKLTFLFNEESPPENMSQFSDMEIKERNKEIIMQNKNNKASGKYGGRSKRSKPEQKKPTTTRTPKTRTPKTETPKQPDQNSTPHDTRSHDTRPHDTRPHDTRPPQTTTTKPSASENKQKGGNKNTPP